MDAPMVGPAALGSGGDAAPSGGLQQPSSGARPGDFQARMERLNQQEVGGFGGAPSQRPKPTREEDPSVMDKTPDGSQFESNDEYEVDDLAQVDPEPEAIEGEYEDATTQARAEFLQKLGDILEQGRLPLDMLGDQIVEKTLPNGRKIEVTLSELDRGFMRQNDYTRKLSEAQAIKGQGEHIINLERQRRQEWQNEDLLMQGLQEMGLWQAFERAVYKHAERTVQFRALPPHEQQRIQLERQLHAERQQRAQEIAQLRAAQNQPNLQAQQAEVTAHFNRQLNQLLPPVFKELKLPHYRRAHDKFIENLKIIYDGGELTADLVRQAGMATKEELDDEAFRAREAMPPRSQGALPARRVSGNAAQTMQQQSNGKRRRPSDFAKKFATSGMG